MPQKYTPRAFQREATRFLIEHKRCALFMEPGTGKTSTVAEAIDILMMAGFAEQVLIVAPLRVARSTWKEEFAKWDHLCLYEVACMVGTPEQRLAALLSPAKIKTINFENLPWLFEVLKKLKKTFPFRIIAIDESSKLKSMRTSWQTSSKGKAFLKVDEGMRVKELLKASWGPETVTDTYVWLLTGSPCDDRLGDLWPQMFFIDGGKSLGKTYSDFEMRWWRIGYNRWDKKIVPHAEEEIKALIAPHVFTVRAEDYMELGEEIETNIYVELPSSVRTQYDEFEKESFLELKVKDNVIEIESFTAATSQLKLRQIANGSLYIDKEKNIEEMHDEKIQALESIVEESGSTPLLVVYHFKSDLAKLLKAFPKGKAFDTKPKTEENFKAGKIPLLFIHPQGAGHGLNGMEYVTNKVVFYSLDWSNENRKQVIARIGKVRRRQANLDGPCFIFNIVTRDTVDEILLDRIASKTTVANSVKQYLARRGLI